MFTARRYGKNAGYTGGGSGFRRTKMADWMPPAESVDAALLPSLRLGNARADDLVRNGICSKCGWRCTRIAMSGHLNNISYRPNWRYLDA